MSGLFDEILFEARLNESRATGARAAWLKQQLGDTPKRRRPLRGLKGAAKFAFDELLDGGRARASESGVDAALARKALEARE